MTQEMMANELDNLYAKMNAWIDKTLAEKYPNDFLAQMFSENAGPTPWDEEYIEKKHEYFLAYGEPYNPYRNTWRWIESGVDV